MHADTSPHRRAMVGVIAALLAVHAGTTPVMARDAARSATPATARAPTIAPIGSTDSGPAANATAVAAPEARPAAAAGVEPPSAAGGPQGRPAASVRWSASADLSGDGYRWSLSHGVFDVSLHFDGIGIAARRRGLPIDAAAPIGVALPSFSVGLSNIKSGEPASAASLLARAVGVADEPTGVSKVGIQWKPAEPELKFLREGLGLRLDANNRMTVRLRKGMLGLYFRRKF